MEHENYKDIKAKDFIAGTTSLLQLSRNSIKKFNYGSQLFDFNNVDYQAGFYKIGTNENVLNPPDEIVSYGNVMVVKEDGADTLSMIAFPFRSNNVSGFFYRSGSKAQWAQLPWLQMASKDDVNAIITNTGIVNPNGSEFSLSIDGIDADWCPVMQLVDCLETIKLINFPAVGTMRVTLTGNVTSVLRYILWYRKK